MCRDARLKWNFLVIFSKIAKICNILPNKTMLLNHLSCTRSYAYECNPFTDSRNTLVSRPFFSPRYSKLVRKTTPVYMNENSLHRRTAMARNAISERIDFIPNETKEVSLQKCRMILEKLQNFQGLLKK